VLVKKLKNLIPFGPHKFFDMALPARTISYISAVMHPDDEKLLLAALSKLNIAGLVKALHVTIIYSKFTPTIEHVAEYKTPVVGKYKGFIQLPTDKENKTMLAIEWDAPGLSQRREQEMKKDGATSDFPTWPFHSTVSYSTAEIPEAVSSLPASVRFIGEKFEKFDE